MTKNHGQPDQSGIKHKIFYSLYSFPTLNYPKSGHFFNQTDQLIIQFIFLEEEEFETFKSKVNCQWDVVNDN